MADSRAGRPRLRRITGSVRVRTTALVTLAVSIALVAAAYSVLTLHRDSLVDNVDTAIRLRADDLEALIRADQLPRSFQQSDSEIAAVQVVDAEGSVLASTSNLEGEAPISDRQPSAGSDSLLDIEGLPIDDEDFRLLARTVNSGGSTYTLYVAGSLDPVHESTDSLASIIWVGLPILVAAIAVGTWFVVGRALSPVEEMRRQVSAISATNLERRVPDPGTGDEIGRLATTMNEMLARLEASNERQRRFVADASHELRSPVTSLRAQLEVELAEPASPERRKALEDSLAEVLRMQRLIDHLLALAQSEEGHLERRPLDLDDIVLDEVRRLTSEQGARIDASLVSAGQVSGDSDQLRRAVRNLLENAVRHATTKVRISLGETGDAVLLSVSDDGPGIPPGQRATVFERFGRLDDARAREQGGAGLGLAITRGIIEAHGGTIEIADDPAPGAHFEIRLPRLSAGG